MAFEILNLASSLGYFELPRGFLVSYYQGGFWCRITKGVFGVVLPRGFLVSYYQGGFWCRVVRVLCHVLIQLQSDFRKCAVLKWQWKLTAHSSYIQFLL